MGNISAIKPNSIRTNTLVLLKYKGHCPIIQALNQLPVENLEAVGYCSVSGGEIAVAHYHGVLVDVLAVVVDPYIHQGLLTIFVQAIVKTHPNAARLSQDLINNIAAQDITAGFFRLSGCFIGFYEVASKLVADLFPNSSVVFFGK